MAKEPTQDPHQLIEALEKHLRRFAEQQGLSLDPLKAAVDDTALHVSVSLFQGDREHYYRERFVQHARALHLDPDWLDASVTDPAGKSWLIIGLDPEMGEAPVRLKSEDGVLGFAPATAVKTWMLHAGP